MFNIIQVARQATGQSQTVFAANAGLVQADLSEMESRSKAGGHLRKYRKVAEYTGIPLDALLRNDFRQIPLSFGSRFPVPDYKPAADSPKAKLGRIGEDLVFEREKKRLQGSFPSLARMVLPYYKMHGKCYPGYDILSYDDDGVPMAVEVKTSEADTDTFRLSSNELATARRITASGGIYCVVLVRGLGTPAQMVEDMTYQELEERYVLSPAAYHCRPKPVERKVSGLMYHRVRMGISQTELAQQMGVPQSKLSAAENCFYQFEVDKWLAKEGENFDEKELDWPFAGADSIDAGSAGVFDRLRKERSYRVAERNF